MTMADYKELQRKENVAAHSVVGIAIAIFKCHKYGMEIQDTTWSLLENRLAEFARLEKDVCRCLEMESEMASLLEA